MKTRYFKNRFFRGIAAALFLLVVQNAMAQQPAPTVPDTSKMTYNQISNTMKLYVFPSKGQSKDQQKQDEFACYNWAVEQSGIDPLNLPKVEAPPPQTGPTGGAVVGAAKGAAVGVAIGAIAGDAGKGAAIGAVAGGVAGRRAGKQAQAQQNQQAEAAVAKTEQDMRNSFQKAFSACIEGKGYTIK
ncbi:glycine zipper domain-containing protein [Flavihumibacter fluvii]|uniref:glycine zipper domain-containing protein n=1 Tax=Flavihumibacter fluvii TaxID=2838157 RepID=UPI001BDF1224|nr:glycine zipper domain-containing protein [Flavihumibacter fluvii]ULQ54127.1 hypothetical protein KJS93_07315 [Flavihumibacter fluvii]